MYQFDTTATSQSVNTLLNGRRGTPNGKKTNNATVREISFVFLHLECITDVALSCVDVLNADEIRTLTHQFRRTRRLLLISVRCVHCSQQMYLCSIGM